ncbi:DUF4312 family protein [Companilactobacillus keshanensis]|uniref:DUF4312 family protein n=1 Tax=Companilactobacillus keshanensis TaxID=2486003 RepID=A0ABW4BU20_9LACO|nr:DUF4312 family protein [Companilactobacillus keshanensis]
MKKDSQKIVEKILVVAGNGGSKKEAVADALAKVSKTISQDIDLTIQITPVSVEIKEAKVNEYIEHFLFFFLPRKREMYQVSLRVTTEIKYLDLNEIKFIENQVTDPNGLQLPRFWSRQRED